MFVNLVCSWSVVAAESRLVMYLSRNSRFYANTHQDKLMVLDWMSLEGKPEYLITKRYIDQVRENYNDQIAHIAVPIELAMQRDFASQNVTNTLVRILKK